MSSTRTHRMPAVRTTRTITRVGRAAVLAATTLALAAGTVAPATAAAPTAASSSSAQSAAATAMRANLHLTALGGNQYRLTVDGVIPMTKADAQGFLDNLGSHGGMQFRIKGWDGFAGSHQLGTTYYSSPSLPGTHAGGWLYAGAEGIHFRREYQAPGSVLNEDRSWSNQDDEIYVNVRFVDGDGGVREANSNIVRAYFY
ncbi:MAG: hypothetical protein L0I24_07895 [Pseudonocardia sp.]|nr:hypothetical protein [Pseudonocardia sp.]